MLIVGGSAYPREIDFKKVREIVDKYNKIWENEIKSFFERNGIETYSEETVMTIASYKVNDDFWCSGFSISKNDNWESVYKKYKCIMMVDMAHIAGLIAAKEHILNIHPELGFLHFNSKAELNRWIKSQTSLYGNKVTITTLGEPIIMLNNKRHLMVSSR